MAMLNNQGKTWSQMQLWDNLLFAHWPIAPDVMRAAIPAALDLDTFDGRAWLGLVPFEITGWRFRHLPPIPGLTGFPELNLRTYVTAGSKDGKRGKPGVYFFSLDAAHLIAVVGARTFFNLPYFYAKMRIRRDAKTDQFHYQSFRRNADATASGATTGQFVGRYRPIGERYYAAPDSLDYWLTERYCLYTVDRHNHAYRADIEHTQWKLQPVEAEIDLNTVTSRFTLPDTPPLLHFSRRQAAYILMPKRVR